MLTRITLINWEGYIHCVIDFSKIVTMFKGESNNGKSSVFRAFMFVFLNKFKEKNINFDAEECSVEIELDGHIIKRVRNRKTKNEYWLDGKCFKAFGKDIPQEIKEIFQMADINYEWQYDSRPFLLGTSGGAVATKINTFVNLEKIDTSLKKVNSLLRASNRDLEQQKTSSMELYNECEQLKWVDEAITQLEDIKVVDNQHVALVEELERLDVLSKATQAVNKDLEQIETVPLEQIEDLQSLVNLEKDYKDKETIVGLITDIKNEIVFVSEQLEKISLIEETELDDFQSSCDNFRKESETIDSIADCISQYKVVNDGLDKLVIIPKISLARYEYSLKSFEKLQDGIKGIADLVDEYRETFNIMCFCDEKLCSYKQEYEELAPDRCPLCGNLMNKEID